MIQFTQEDIANIVKPLKEELGEARHKTKEWRFPLEHHPDFRLYISHRNEGKNNSTEVVILLDNQYLVHLDSIEGPRSRVDSLFEAVRKSLETLANNYNTIEKGESAHLHIGGYNSLNDQIHLALAEKAFYAYVREGKLPNATKDMKPFVREEREIEL